ncbi:hypothetical protein ABT213_02740 [Streptomyces sp. NPDC001674]|uniref:hypothetical protein n=1 Tax=unclassified Streptomyces TaxID=2593676 RepID=UPI00331D28BC
MRITAAGYAEVGGRPVIAGAGEAVQDAVLDYLHRQVLSTGAEVFATVRDERIVHVVRIHVLSDGSSRFTAPPEPIPVTGAAAVEEAAELVPAPMDPAPLVPVPAPVPVTPAVPVSDQPVDDLVTGPGQRIYEALQQGRIEWAATLAQQSVNVAAERLGWDSPEVLRLRELNAYVAFVAGDSIRAFYSSLEIARVRSSRNDSQVMQSVLNAAAAWLKITDPVEGARMGRELLALWVTRPEADAAQLESARARMSRLEQQV